MLCQTAAITFGSTARTEMGRGQRNTETGVLHPHFNGSRPSFTFIQTHKKRGQITKEQSPQIVEKNGCENQKSRSSNAFHVAAHDHRNNNYNGNNRYERNNGSTFIYRSREKPADQNAECDWNNDHLHDGNKHGHRIHRQPLPCQRQQYERCQQHRCKHRDARYTLAGIVELDDALFGAPKEDGKRGRGTDMQRVFKFHYMENDVELKGSLA